MATIRDLQEIIDNVLLSEEERKIIWKIYREQKPIDVVADEIGLSRATVTRKHHKALLKIGKVFK